MIIHKLDCWGDTAFYVKGRVHANDFAKEIEKEYGLAIGKSDVRHGYLRKVPDSTREYTHTVHPSSKGPGAFEATYWGL